MFGKNKVNTESTNGTYKVVSVLDNLNQFENEVSALLDSGDWQLVGGMSVAKMELMALYSQALNKKEL